MTASHDVGRAINPRVVEGQIDGQIFSGMSQVLYEETIMEDGQVMNPSRLDYKMPRAYEMPEVAHIIVETIDPFGPVRRQGGRRGADRLHDAGHR